MTEQLSDWTHNVADIPEGGLDREREASESERIAIAEDLRLLKLDRLAARYRIKPLADGGYRLSGRVMSAVEQACVVTLDPVADEIDAPFDVEFRQQVDRADNDEEASVLAGSDVDSLERGVIPVGRIVRETLSASLDPYPRRPGAEFTWQDPRGIEPKETSPFAVLSQLKNKT
ncbi:hypothetical protein HYPDE_29473 [Hyphomicrobium denitrificans 1NES1]|uniref:DUF177 domain-containing protein n=1 Tax=Hyphomicrobium denitrificans 1NES1 TaxID=670307 RepID=N0BBS4_9HYPH|nr:YceD family protein [Hyphomicrobium denitrificans]AGK57570.1 hypothetical protein HYPDE_29473 [Hyphomicrobium denitrificans 1NES1]